MLADPPACTLNPGIAQKPSHILYIAVITQEIFFKIA
jgi:hypothetical protein